VEERLRRVLVHVQRQIGVLDAQEDIKSQVQEELGERQREMFLREQLKTIQRELGEGDERDDLQELREKLEALDLPAEARKEVDRELNRLSRIGRESMESQVIRTFLENIVELPWNVRSKEHLELPEAQRILDEDHYALGDVKDRVLEFLAVRQLRMQQDAAASAAEEDKAERKAEEVAHGESTDTPQATATVPAPNVPVKGNDDDRARGPILLFVGPPGTGKTSVAKSIARAMGRKYVRISLGGARDEADIRGHRRTYVGAMPGRIIQGMKQAGTKNPVFLLDEVDNLRVSFQGDPASAKHEVLDPAQNESYVDH
jgi:ATP-dependent Lon protease